MIGTYEITMIGQTEDEWMFVQEDESLPIDGLSLRKSSTPLRPDRIRITLSILPEDC